MEQRSAKTSQLGISFNLESNAEEATSCGGGWDVAITFSGDDMLCLSVQSTLACKTCQIRGIWGHSPSPQKISKTRSFEIEFESDFNSLSD